VAGSVQIVLGLDDQAPTGPDETSASQGKVLGKGQLFGGTGKVGNTGNNESPLTDEHVSRRCNVEEGDIFGCPCN
jgi:glutamine cyclotransferase